VPNGFISSPPEGLAPPEPARAPQACFKTLVPVHDSVSFGEGNLPRMERGFPFTSFARITPFTAHVFQHSLLEQ